MGNKDQKRQKDNPQDKSDTEKQKKSFQDFKQNAPKPFQQFSNPNKSGGPSKSFNAFHRRLGK